MKEVLRLSSNDSTLSNIIKKYPFYIDIKGSVSICLIKCAQDIETCNDVTLSIMKNEGKILLVKPNNSKTKCKINLAFDSNNENHNNDGTGMYTFEQAFFTVPSLHRINGKQYDQETFIVFSSTQSNGSKLYCVLCTLNNSVDSLPTDETKLVNYKLLDELFAGTHDIPEKNGTKSLDVNVDLENFIPKKGSRSFYEYTHPDNPEVDFRIFQTSLDISSTALSGLRKKLTPSIVYGDFSEALKQNINPKEGLFIYYSQDVFNNYKSFYTNQDHEDTKKIEDFDEKKIPEELKNEEEEEFDIVGKLKKLKFEEKNKETFLSGNYKDKKIFAVNTENLDVDKSFNSIDDALKSNNNYKIEGISQSIDDYPNIIYEGYYWRTVSQVNLYKVDEDSDLYDLQITRITDDSSDQSKLNDLVAQKTGKSKIDNKVAMQNFPYQKAGDYYIQNVYITTSSSKFNRMLIIFIIWAIILCNYFFYKIVYYIFNYNYDSTIELTDNEILNNKIGMKLASNRIWIYSLLIFNIIISIIFSIYTGLGGNNIGPYVLISIITLLTIFKTIIYICNRKKYGNLNILCNVEDRSINLFLNQNSENNNSFYGKTNNVFSNISSLLLNTLTDVPSFECLISKYSNDENKKPVKIILHGGGEGIEDRKPPLYPSNRLSDKYEFQGLPYYPNKYELNNNLENNISIDQLTEDNDHLYRIHIDSLYSYKNILWIISIIIIFWVIRESIFGYFYQKFDQLGESKAYFGVILTEHIMSSIFYFLASFVILNPTIYKITSIFEWIWKKIGSDYKKIGFWICACIVISAFIIFFIVLIFGLVGNSSRSGSFAGLSITFIILLTFALLFLLFMKSNFFKSSQNIDHIPFVTPPDRSGLDASTSTTGAIHIGSYRNGTSTGSVGTTSGFSDRDSFVPPLHESNSITGKTTLPSPTAPAAGTNPVTDATQSTNPVTDATQSTNPVTDATQSTNPVTDATQSTNPVTDATQSTKSDNGSISGNESTSSNINEDGTINEKQVRIYKKIRIRFTVNY